jgi:hypothetical protein
VAKRKRMNEKSGAKPPKIDPHRFDAGAARRDLVVTEIDHDAVARPIWAAIEACSGAINPMSPGDKILVALMQAMRETHNSMRAIYTAAGLMEKKEGQSGRWVDMLLLARAQYDAAFNGLLVAHDEAQWAPRYRKAGWAAMARQHFYGLRRFKNTSAGASLKPVNLRRLKAMARCEGVTVREWVATAAEVRGTSLRCSATTADRIDPLPTPGEIVAKKYLADGSYEALGRLLWQHWKFLCDPAHVGIATLWLRVLIRDVPQDCVPIGRRQEFINEHVVSQSVIPSLVATLTLVAVFAVRHQDNPDLLAKVVTAWGPLEHTLEGGVVWDGWARGALGVLAPTDGSSVTL